MEVHGREREIASIRSVLDAPHRFPAALLISGEPGIGKTTLWRYALDRARERSLCVLECVGAQTETPFPYAALADLLRGREEDLLALPPPQRRALEGAVLVSGPVEERLDQRALAFGFVSLLHALSRDRPVLLAVDDALWLDPASATILEFAMRRLGDAPVGVVLDWRAEHQGPAPLGIDRALPPERVHQLHLGSLDVAALHRLLRERLGTTYSGAELRRLHEVAGGNPFFALELARALLRRRARVQVGEPLPVPETIYGLFQERLEELPALTRKALLALASCSTVTMPLLDEVLASEAELHLRPALDAGLVEVVDRVPRFVHPLVASAVYEEAGEAQRRAVHARLAQLVADPLEAARHLAISTPAPDARLAGLLQQAAERAALRGAPAAAAELAELATRFAEDAASRRQALLTAAEQYFTAGQPQRSVEVLEPLLPELSAGVERARALCQLAMIHAPDARGMQLLEEALEQARDEPSLASFIHLWSSFVHLLRLDLGAALHHARTGTTLGKQAHDDGAVLEGLSQQLLVELCAGEEVTEAEMQLALDEQRRLADVHVRGYQPTLVAGLRLMYQDRHEDARQMLELAERHAAAHGDEEMLDAARLHRVELELRAGAWDRAAALAQDVRAFSEQLGLAERIALADHLDALLAVYRGDESEARSRGEAALSVLRAAGQAFWEIQIESALGLLELSLGNADAAAKALEGVVRRLVDGGWGEPTFLRPAGDLVEALVERGDVPGATRVLTGLEERLAPPETPLGVALLARCRGVLAAARGASDEAIAALDRGLAEERVDPFERGRLLFVRGVALRRARRRGAARQSLEEARVIFDGLGARLWSERVGRSMQRLGKPGGGYLTAAEERIATLAAEGYANKEIAATLFLSVKTVEANLTRVYAKLGVRSRAQLLRRLADADVRGGDRLLPSQRL